WRLPPALVPELPRQRHGIARHSWEVATRQSGTSWSVIAKLASVGSPLLSFGIGNRQAVMRLPMHSSTSLEKPCAEPFTVRPVSLIESDREILPRALASFLRNSL